MLKDLHSTMYLLNRSWDSSYLSLKPSFTFHYVSIKSCRLELYANICMNLHSTMYLLNPKEGLDAPTLRYDLHSTMYLLNRYDEDTEHKIRLHLHSTMYLLNRAGRG